MVAVGKVVVSENSGICTMLINDTAEEVVTIKEALICRGTQNTSITVDKSYKFIAIYQKNLLLVSSLLESSKYATISLEKLLYKEFSPSSDYIAVWQSIPVQNTNTEKTGFGKFSIFKIRDLGDSLGLDLCTAFDHPYPDSNEFYWSGEQFLAMCYGRNFLRFNYGQDFKISDKKPFNGVESASLRGSNYAVFINEKNKPLKFIKLLKFVSNDKHADLALKTMSDGESAAFYWNESAKFVLVLVTGKSTNTSYYGLKTLYFLGVNGDCYAIGYDKKDKSVQTVHSVAWNPRGCSFSCIVGSLPACLDIYDTKCNLIFRLNPECRNAIYYNSFGNLICTTAHGNAHGPVEILNVESFKLVSRFKVDYITDCYWMPDGVHILFCVFSPKLTVHNGFQMWRYTGEMIITYEPGCELWFLRPMLIPNYSYSKPYVVSLETPKDLIGKSSAKKYVPTADTKYGLADLPPKKNVSSKPEAKAKYLADWKSGKSEK